MDKRTSTRPNEEGPHESDWWEEMERRCRAVEEGNPAKPGFVAMMKLVAYLAVAEQEIAPEVHEMLDRSLADEMTPDEVSERLRSRLEELQR